MTAASGLLVVVTILVTTIFASSGWNSAMFIVAATLVIASIASVAKTIAMFKNTTRLEFDRGEFLVIDGPFPWTSRRAFQGDMIEQVYVHGVITSRPFARRLTGPFDIVARLNDGTWQSIVRGCRNEKEAKSVERWIEKKLRIPNEYGPTDDAERSEVFTQWRDSLGTIPNSISVDDDGERIEIKYRAALSQTISAIALAITVVALGVWILAQSNAFHFGHTIWCVIMALVIGNVAGLLFSRHIITIDQDSITRRSTWPPWNRRTTKIAFNTITRLDCRSRAVRYHRGKFGTFYKRRYWVQAKVKNAGTFHITHDLHNRNTALQIMKLIADKLEIEPSPTSG